MRKNIIDNSSVITIGGTKSSQFYQEKFQNNNLEGISTPIDIYDCNLELIQSKKYIQLFINELCVKFKWSQIGETYMKYFDNEDPGITFKQRTDQGLVSAHFKDLTLGACFDIHSRDYYNPNKISEFSKKFFEGGKTILDVSYRKKIYKTNNPEDIKTTGGYQTEDYYKTKFLSENLWGMSTAIDMYQCDLEKISVQNNITIEQYIKNFVKDLCIAIDMVTDGKTQVNHISHYGKRGTEFSQVITTSLITGHIRYDIKSAYFEIFSCKFYNPNFLAEFVKNYFSGGSTEIYVSYRGKK